MSTPAAAVSRPTASPPSRARTTAPWSARLLPGLGLLYPVLTVLAYVAFPSPPGGDVSAVHDPGWLAGHLGPVTAQAFVRSLGALGFLALGAAASAWVRRPWSAVLVTCGAATATLLVLAQGAVLAGVHAVGQHAGSDLGALDSLNAALLDLSSLPAVAVFGVTGAGLLGARGASRALGLLSLAGVPLALLDSVSYVGGPVGWFGLVGLAYFLLWSLVVGGFLVGRPLPTVDAPGQAGSSSATG